MTTPPNLTFMTIPANPGGWGVDSRPPYQVRGMLRGSGLDLFRPFLADLLS